MADKVEILGETGESPKMAEPAPVPPPTIDDIAIPPPPVEDAPPPPPLDEDTSLDIPPGEESSTPLPNSDNVPPAAEPDPEALEEPQGTAIVDVSEIKDTGSTGKDQTIPGDLGSPLPNNPVTSEEQQGTAIVDVSDINDTQSTGKDQTLPSDLGSTLPPYDSGIEAPSTSTADMSGMEGKALQSEFDEIQIEDSEERNESPSSIHNANTLPSTRPMTTTVANQQALVTGYVEMSPEETKAEMKRVSTYRREATMWVTIFLLLAGAIAVIFYFTYNITTLSDASLPDGEFNVRAVMILNYPWDDDLAISTTSAHIQLADNITQGINSTFTAQDSAFSSVFQGTDMIYFSDEDASTRVSFQCEFSGPPTDEIQTQPGFSEIFLSELIDGFDAGNFYNLGLNDQQSANVLQFAAS